MEPEQIATISDFAIFLRRLSEGAASYPGTLEKYLCGVLRVVSAYEAAVPSTRLIAQALADGFTVAPMPFDPAWLAFTNPPDLITKPQANSMRPFEAVLHMLRYQIADLRRMAETGAMENKYRYLGIQSPAGHSWYTFDPQTFLECASYGLGDSQEPADLTWDDLVVILWLGQIYE